MKSPTGEEIIKATMKGQNRSTRPRKSHQQIQQEREEIREYLAKLRQIVPACPKDGKISRLDLIQHVIDYIIQLQETLVRHPVNKFLSTEGAAHPITPPGSPLNSSSTQQILLTNHAQRLADNHSNVTSHNICNVTPTVCNNASSRLGSKSSNCRRPLGLLASLNQHRNI